MVLVFAVREPSEHHELRGLPELASEGLGDAHARLVLASAIPGWLDERVRERILAEARGNPVALLLAAADPQPSTAPGEPHSRHDSSDAPLSHTARPQHTAGPHPP